MIMCRIFTICILFAIINLSSNLIISKKLSNKYNNKYNKNEVIGNSYDYPGSNNDFRQIQKKQWLQYYACLIKKYAQIKSQEILHPAALVVLEGTSITLKCDICISPLEVNGINTIEWYFNSSSNYNTTNEVIQSGQHILVTQNNKYLQIYDIQLQQDGQYWCKMKDTIETPYYVHVDNGSEGINIIHPDAVSNAQPPLLSTIIKEYNIKVYTTWANWSPCSKCDSIGIKIRYGYCTLSLLENSINADKDKTKLSEVNENMHWNVETKKNIQLVLETLFVVFKNVLPCKFRYIPNDIQKHLIIKQRKTEMMIQYCKKKCLNDGIFEKNNKESIIKNASIYSTFQKIPSLVPTVTRKVLYVKNNRKIEIKCPGNLNTDIPITWKIGSKPLLPLFTKSQLNARVYINPRMHVVIRKVNFTDNNIYSCWQGSELAGIVKLIVTGEIELKVNYQIMLFGTIVIISAFTVVIWRAFKGKLRYTKH